jgi:hypothetical protein
MLSTCIRPVCAISQRGKAFALSVTSLEKTSPTQFSGLVYFPVEWPFLLSLFVLFSLLVAFVEFRVLHYPYEQIALTTPSSGSSSSASLSSDKKRYPIQEFQAFWTFARQYAELTFSDPLIHKDVAGAVNGLLDFLRLKRKRVPRDVLRNADRLESILFGGYDPHFDGDEPPEL